jgi:hypothetical protein
LFASFSASRHSSGVPCALAGHVSTRTCMHAGPKHTHRRPIFAAAGECQRLFVNKCSWLVGWFVGSGLDYKSRQRATCMATLTGTSQVAAATVPSSHLQLTELHISFGLGSGRRFCADPVSNRQRRRIRLVPGYIWASCDPRCSGGADRQVLLPLHQGLSLSDRPLLSRASRWPRADSPRLVFNPLTAA